MKKQLFGLALSLALAVSCLAAPALAAEPEATEAASQSTQTASSASDETAAELVEQLAEETAEPTPTSTEQPETTPTPTPTPTEQPQATATPAPTEQPTATATPAATQQAGEDEDTVPGQAEHTFTYVALGDSITAGNGLSDFQYAPAKIGVDVSPNFLGYSSDCFVAKVAENLGLDRKHAINLGLPELMTGDMLDLLQNGAMPQMNQPAGTYYVYPEYPEYVKQADVITLQIGTNDALVPFIVSIGNATNWKSEQFANSLVTGAFRNFWSQESMDLLKESLSKLTLTKAEKAALNYALGDGMKSVCNAAYQDVTANFPKIIEAIRELNPDVDIILVGYYNPAWMLPTWSNYFNKLNRYEKQLAKDYGLTYVDIGWTCTANDMHPTLNGHKYIARKLTSAIKKQPSYKEYQSTVAVS